MVLLVVDPDKCDLCQICVAACPADLIRTSNRASVPMLADDNDEACVACGHCVAACPTGALAHQATSLEQCLPIRDELRVSAEQAGQLMRSRRSIRNYEDRIVTRETITQLLDVARYAPSGCNAQPVHWLVIHDTAQVRQIASLVVEGLRDMVQREPASPLSTILERLVKSWDDGTDSISRGAPHLIIAHAPKADPAAASACIIAQTYLELAASAFGLGACWMGLIDMTANSWPPLRQFLALPDDHVALGTVAIGHPKFNYTRIPPRHDLRVDWR